jgi:hypothetical protein
MDASAAGQLRLDTLAKRGDESSVLPRRHTHTGDGPLTSVDYPKISGGLLSIPAEAIVSCLEPFRQAWYGSGSSL